MLGRLFVCFLCVSLDWSRLDGLCLSAFVPFVRGKGLQINKIELRGSITCAEIEASISCFLRQHLLLSHRNINLLSTKYSLIQSYSCPSCKYQLFCLTFRLRQRSLAYNTLLQFWIPCSAKLISSQILTALTLQTQLQTSTKLIRRRSQSYLLPHHDSLSHSSMPVNWKNPDAFTRLLAAMVAAQDMKVCLQTLLDVTRHRKYYPLLARILPFVCS